VVDWLISLDLDVMAEWAKAKEFTFETLRLATKVGFLLDDAEQRPRFDDAEVMAAACQEWGRYEQLLLRRCKDADLAHAAVDRRTHSGSSPALSQADDGNGERSNSGGGEAVELGASFDACINLAQSPHSGHRATKRNGAGAVADTQDAPSSHLAITPPTSPGTPGSEAAAGTCSSDSRPWSARAFRDFGCLTFVMCSRGVCVEAQRPGSEHAAWSRLKVAPGDVLLFVGETLEFWTDSKLPAVGYRSVPDPNDGGVEQAYTIEFHLNASEGTEYAPPAALLSDGVAKQQGRCDVGLMLACLVSTDFHV
jgi:hypothetical protein